ncbi:unnamed protein product [Victoria cruziana]
MTFVEASMENRSFAKALQELKNLRPQLYSAAEYCEKSYVHNEEKQMVLDNLKDYAVKALINAVDHLGTVAYKLEELLEQQTLETSAMDLKFVCLDQRLLTCQNYTDKEGLREQQFSMAIPRHHKHYLLPGSVSNRRQTNTRIGESGRKFVLGKPRPYGSVTPATKSLCWHLASEIRSSPNDVCPASASIELASAIAPGTFFLSDGEADVLSASSSHGWTSSVNSQHSSTVSLLALGAARQDSHDRLKLLTAHKSFGSGSQRQTPRPPVRSKSMLSALFGKTKSGKHNMIHSSYQA